MDNHEDLITRVLAAHSVELRLVRALAHPVSYREHRVLYAQWLIACGETDAARSRLRAAIQAGAAMPPTITDLQPGV